MDDKIDLISDIEDENQNKKGDGLLGGCVLYVPRRYILALLLVLGTANSFAVRVNFNVALVAMVNDTSSEDLNNTVGECGGPANFTTKRKGDGEFYWSPAMQSLLLGSYYYGYPVLQPLGGYLADRFGAKWLIASTGITAGIINLLIPVTAHWNPNALVVLRAFLGLGQGCLWPSLSAMLAAWTTTRERNTVFAFCDGGSFLGTVISQTLSGVLCDSDFLGGWPAAFYLFGILSLLWSAAFIFLTTNCPATHPSISDEEKRLLMTDNDGVKYKSIPWKEMLTSRPFLAFLFTLFMHVTAYDIIFTFLPLYMKRVLKYDISSSGALASLPYVTAFFVTFLAGSSSDVITNRGWLSKMWTRRIYTILCELLQALLVLTISMLGCDRVAVVICFILTVSVSGFCNGGFGVNVFDIAPRYAGVLYGVANGFTNIGGFAGPLIVGALTSVSGNLDSWKVVFYMVAGFYVLACIVFCVFGSADLQPWANPTTETLTPVNAESIQGEHSSKDSEDSTSGRKY